MACFLVTTAAAVGVATAKYVTKHQEKKKDPAVVEEKLINSKKLKYLELTLWGGSFVLAGEHMIHHEVVPFPPFLTAMSSAEDTAEMLHEMGTTGVLMFGLLVAAWAVGVFLVDFIKYRKHKKVIAKKLEEAK